MEKLDLLKILHQCPIGTPLYSTAFGTVLYQGLLEGLPEEESAIVTTMANKNPFSPTTEQYFRYDGTLVTSQKDAECILFPSYNQRDWSSFKAPKSKMSVTLHPFDKVLVRDGCSEEWHAGILSSIEYDQISNHPFSTAGGYWRHCVPYNENTAHLLGTSDEPDEEYEMLFSKDFNVI